MRQRGKNEEAVPSRDRRAYLALVKAREVEMMHRRKIRAIFELEFEVEAGGGDGLEDGEGLASLARRRETGNADLCEVRDVEIRALRRDVGLA